MSLGGPLGRPPSSCFSGETSNTPGLGGRAELTNTARLGGGSQPSPSGSPLQPEQIPPGTSKPAACLPGHRAATMLSLLTYKSIAAEGRLAWAPTWNMEPCLGGCEVGTPGSPRPGNRNCVPRPLGEPLERLPQPGLSSEKAGSTPPQQGVTGHIKALGNGDHKPVNLLLPQRPPCFQGLLITNVMVW